MEYDDFKKEATQMFVSGEIRANEMHVTIERLISEYEKKNNCKIERK